MNEQTRILIVGFMGAGKTSVARELARLLRASMLDLDDAITKSEGRTPQQLIDEDGEPAFRAAETRALAAALDEDKGAARVIALGGGAWSIEANRELVTRHNCLTIWLDAPFELCWQRIRESSNSRPFARDKERARNLYGRRREAYALADLRVQVAAGKNAQEIAREITRDMPAREGS